LHLGGVLSESSVDVEGDMGLAWLSSGQLHLPGAFEVFVDPFWCIDYSIDNADASFTHRRVIFWGEHWVVHMWWPCATDSDCALCHINNSIRRDPGIISTGLVGTATVLCVPDVEACALGR